jgi:hypothetical protein
MLSNNYFNMESTILAQRINFPDRDPHAFIDAVNLYERVFHKVVLEKAWNWISGRQTANPMDLDEVKAQVKVTNSHYCGLREVPLNRIRGTQGRVSDFDAQFRPVAERVKNRWVSVAAAWYQGLGLPPVELVKMGSFYFVVDGNHRVSVARAMGKHEIDAEVVEWQVAGRLPWEMETCGMINQTAAVV